MQIANLPLVEQTVDAAASALRNLCIRLTSQISLRSTSLSKVAAPYPPLVCNLDIDGVDLSVIPHAFYKVSEPVDLQKLAQAFVAFGEARNGHKKAAKVLRHLVAEAAPNIPFTTPPGLSVTAELVQLIYVASWYGLQCSIFNNLVTFDIDGGQYRIESGAYEWPGSRSKMRRPLGMNFLTLLEQPLKPAAFSSPKAGAVYRYLVETLPDYRRQIELVLSAAVHGGQKTQSAFWRAFDVEHVDVGPAPPIVYAVHRAISLISRSKTMPYKGLREILVPHIGYDSFRSIFGSASRWGGRYSAHTAERHRLYLLSLQDDAIGAVAGVVGESPQPFSEVLQLLNTIR